MTDANAPDLWDRHWKREGPDTWRRHALAEVYTRIVRIVPAGSVVFDFGGGNGALAKRLRDEAECHPTVLDHSREAVRQCKAADIEAHELHIDGAALPQHSADVFTATELLEHLDEPARRSIYEAAHGRTALFSVPNNRLGPDEEPQHCVKFTAVSFAAELRRYFDDVRVEVLGPYLLGVCGVPKSFTLSVCLPVRDEADDLEATLASFRGVADEIVVGVDPRTTDSTREIAALYADVIFELESPDGPVGDKVPDRGVHFAWVRNQCMERCTGDWIFMTEGHERLLTGRGTLLSVDRVVPKAARVGFVLRTGYKQQWAFPWLCRNDPRIRYARSTHNILDYPPNTYQVQLPDVRTLHERTRDMETKRAEQRKIQNRKTLLEDWQLRESEHSLFYLGAEWREHSEDKAVERLEEFLALPQKNGPLRYHARLVLAKLHVRANRREEARRVLLAATSEDWSRTEHWMWLGDLAFEEERFEEALQFYRYLGTTAGMPPFTLWWIDLPSYSYLPAQRLAMTYARLGQVEPAVHWAGRVLELLPDDSPAAVFDEASANLKQLQQALAEAA
jgi:hypothetical protein